MPKNYTNIFLNLKQKTKQHERNPIPKPNRTGLPFSLHQPEKQVQKCKIRM